METVDASLEHLTLANNTSPSGAGLDIWNEEDSFSIIDMTNALISDAAVGMRVLSEDYLNLDGVLWDTTTRLHSPM